VFDPGQPDKTNYLASNKLLPTYAQHDEMHWLLYLNSFNVDTKNDAIATFIAIMKEGGPPPDRRLDKANSTTCAVHLMALLT
jgi:hypothetical protein